MVSWKNILNSAPVAPCFMLRQLFAVPRFSHIRPIARQLQYAIPKINMLRNLMMFQNEVKAAVQ